MRRSRLRAAARRPLPRALLRALTARAFGVGERGGDVDETAERVFELAAKAGVKLTPVGATYPYGDDPEDRNIRIAPTLPPSDELERAITVLATAVLCAADD